MVTVAEGIKSTDKKGTSFINVWEQCGRPLVLDFTQFWQSIFHEEGGLEDVSEFFCLKYCFN